MPTLRAAGAVALSRAAAGEAPEIQLSARVTLATASTAGRAGRLDVPPGSPPSKRECARTKPARQTRRPRRRQADVYRLTRAEAASLLVAASTVRERVIGPGLCASLRNPELRGLRDWHVSRRPGVVWGIPDIAKGGQRREVPVLQDLEPIVDEIRASVADDEYIAPAAQPAAQHGLGRALVAALEPFKAVWRLVIDVAARAGIRAHIHPHVLRHAFGDHVAKYAGPAGRAGTCSAVAWSDTTQRTYVGRVALDELIVAAHGVLRGALRRGAARTTSHRVFHVADVTAWRSPSRS
jgi:integrase